MAFNVVEGDRLAATVAAPAEPATRQANPLAAWPAFSRSVRKRLGAGRREYGDKSFSRPPGELLTEIQQELLDVAGWAYILHQRLEALRAQINAEEFPR